jgi:hypothetical protein
MLAIRKAVGAFFLAIEKVFSSFLSSIAARWLPTPIPNPNSSTVSAIIALILVASGVPPVIAPTISGAANLWLKMVVDKSIFCLSISGKALCTKWMSSKPVVALLAWTFWFKEILM